MLATFVRFSLIATLCALVGCNGVRVLVAGPSLVAPLWGGFVAAPTTTVVILQPGQTLIIIVQPAPTFIAPPSGFFDGFSSANPNIIFACPAIATIGNTFVTPIGAPPAVQIGVTPFNPGICSVPVNLGSGGSVTIIVQIGLQGSTRASTRALRTAQHNKESATRALPLFLP